jgi:hypothetical protein
MDFEAQKLYANIYEDVGLWRLNPFRIKAVTKISGGSPPEHKARMNGCMLGTPQSRIPNFQRNSINVLLGSWSNVHNSPNTAKRD